MRKLKQIETSHGKKLPIFKATILATILGLFTTTEAFADNYTVQIGAYKYLSQRIINQAERYGQVFQNQSTSNLTRVQVGNFDNRSQAVLLLKQLRSAGYRDAFITQLPYTSEATAVGTLQNSDLQNSQLQSSDYGVYNSAETQYVQAPTPVSSQVITFDNLTEEEKSKATFLDEELRIFENGEFMTVSQYRSSR